MTDQRASVDETGPPTTDESDAAADGSGVPVHEASEPPTVDEAVGRIRGRATAIRDRELETALTKLEASGDLSSADREAVAGLADRLVEELVAVPESSLREAAAAGNSEDGEDRDDSRESPVETALELFS